MTTPEAHYLKLFRLLLDNLTDEQTAMLENCDAYPEAARHVLEAAQQEAKLCNGLRNAVSLPAEAEGSCGPGAFDCGFDRCNNDHAGHKEHTWTDGVLGGSLTERSNRRVYVWTSVQDGYAEHLLVGVEDPDDECSGMEAWLSIEDAEYLRDALTTAIGNARTAPIEKVTR
jgi:hypothetical protein